MDANDGTEMPLGIFNKYNNNYLSAINGIDDELAKEFKNNLSRLAAVKTNQLTQALARDKAAGKTAAEMQNTVKRFNRYQVAEYNTAVHRCRVAKQFAGFVASANTYPNIEWVRTRSANPREAHLQYAGRTWPINDPFWNDNQPGCIWNCKCSWRAVNTPATDNSDVTIVPASPGLEGNPYFTKKIFTANHPYYNGVEAHIKDLGVLHNSDDIVYLSRLTTGGKKYQEHYLCQYEGEITGNRAFVDILLDNGFKDVKLLPRINAKEAALRERYYGEKFNEIQPTKCPDAIADDKLIEFKESSERNKLKEVKDASLKSDVSLIRVKNKMTASAINKFGQKCLDELPLKTLIVINNEQVYVFRK